MCYKIGRGNVAKKCLRFHAAVKMVFDYQPVTDMTVAASDAGFQCYEMRTCQTWDDPENAYLSCAKRPDLLTT